MKEKQFQKYLDISNISSAVLILSLMSASISVIIFFIKGIKTHTPNNFYLIFATISISITLISIIITIYYEKKIKKEMMKMIDTEALKILEK